MGPGAQLLFRVQPRRGEVISTWLLRLISCFSFTTMLRNTTVHMRGQSLQKRKNHCKHMSAVWLAVCLIAGFLFYFHMLVQNKTKNPNNPRFNPTPLILSRLGNDTSGWGTVGTLTAPDCLLWEQTEERQQGRLWDGDGWRRPHHRTGVSGHGNIDDKEIKIFFFF